VNNLYATSGRGRRRFATPKYKAWKAEARAMLLSQKPDKVPGRVIIFLSVPPIERSDVDNRNKAAIDLLVRENVIDDDRNVVSVVTSWGTSADKLASIAATPATEMHVHFIPTPDGGGGAWAITDNEPAPGDFSYGT
jgi:Holliday junction resolvase RusA-like endonuclease